MTATKDLKYVYVSGPIRGDGKIPRELNCRKGMLVAEKLFTDFNLIPFVPHASIVWNMVTPMEEKFWVEWSLQWVEKCDILFRFEGYSEGGSGEIARARELGIPVVYSFPELMALFEKLGLECGVDGDGSHAWQDLTGSSDPSEG